MTSQPPFLPPCGDSNMSLYSRARQFSTSPWVRVCVHVCTCPLISSLCFVSQQPALAALLCSSALSLLAHCPCTRGKPETLCPPGFSFTSPCQATVKAQLIACSQAYTPELLGDQAEAVPERSPAGPLAFPVLLLPLCSLASP